MATWNKHLGGVNLPYYASILLFAFAFLLSNNFVGKIDASVAMQTLSRIKRIQYIEQFTTTESTQLNTIAIYIARSQCSLLFYIHVHV